MLIDYHVHARAHGEYSYSPEWISQFLTRAQACDIGQIGFCEHEAYCQDIDFSAVRAAHSNQFQGMRVRIGLEVDYRPGREQEIADLTGSQAFDFIIGSVHHIGDWPFDHPDYKDGFVRQDIDEVYQSYYSLVHRAFESGLFDILGHMDLIKVWGHRPARFSETSFMEPLLKSLKRTGIVVEVNSGGLRKPVSELYPSQAMLDMLFNASIPITFGSDAHKPEEVGTGLKEAFQSARQAGYRIMMCFNRRRQILSPMTY